MAVGIKLSDIQKDTFKIDELEKTLEIQLQYYKINIFADDQEALKLLISNLSSLIEIEKPKVEESNKLPDFYKEMK